MSEVRGRFAPSPSGELHLGNARTALLAWLQARSAGGRFIMRVEDLDPGRSRVEHIASQLEDLRWLGLDWDEGPDVGGAFGPYLQSKRHELYSAALQRLHDMGVTYPCFCTRREIAQAASAPHAGDDEGPPYSGRCAALTKHDVQQSSRPAALRMRVPDGEVGFVDRIAGLQRYRPHLETGDFVVRRKDGVASYQLAVVVDDAAMRITHVLRGADLLSSTARQLLLYEALGLQPPVWIHVPLLLGDDGERLSKRHGAVSIREHREAGTSPERVVGWLAATCGLAAETEELTATQLLPRFALEALHNSATDLFVRSDRL
ncbi:tRNA glutamyl-Q(34) synthetase GluQRS [soil metagenome]